MSDSAVSSNSSSWRERALAVLAGKQSNFRPGPATPALITKSATDHRIFDADGKDYIDFVLGMGPAIWGHSDRDIFDAVIDQLETQFSSASSIMHTTAEIELAEKIVQHVPCAEKVRFGLSGSEADQLAMRLARGYTGRRYVIRFEGHYHGWLDTAFGGLPEAGADQYRPAHSTSREGFGLAEHALDDILMVRWNDLEAFEQLLKDYDGQVALVLMEAVMCNNHACPPRPGYLEGVRELCSKHGSVLCFDEVITGFRMGISGAQGSLGVTPDLAVFGKAMAGGLPLSALAGRADVMSALSENKVLAGGTFNSFPLSMASGLATMKKLEAIGDDYYQRLDICQGKIMQAFRDAASRNGHDIIVQGPRGMLAYIFMKGETIFAPHEMADADQKKAMTLRALMEEEGLLTAAGSRLMVSGALSEEDVNEAIDRINRAFDRLS